MNSESQQQILESIIKDFSGKVKDAADEAITGAECVILPYVLDDTIANAMFQAQDIVEMIMAGNFEHDGEYITVKHPRGDARIRMKFSEHLQYDTLRDRLIERMTTCPKDARIKMLEHSLQESYRRF